MCAHENLDILLGNKLESFFRKNGIRGLAAAAYFDGKPHFYNFGYAHPAQGIPISENTIFDIASISKSFTATLLAKAVLEGRMKLTDTLDDHFPFIHNHPSALSNITLEQLALHTSGLPREDGLGKRAPKKRILQKFSNQPLNSTPGTAFKYSNLGYEILGFALENVYRKPYSQLVMDITRPLDMHSTFTHVPPSMEDYAQGFGKDNRRANHYYKRGFEPSGGIKSSSHDLMNFMMANMKAFGPKDLQDAMALTHKGVFRANPRMVQGLAWQNFTMDGVTMLDKNGGLPGFSSWMGWTPEVGLILLSSRRTPKLTNFGRKLLVTLTKRQRTP